MRTIGPQPYGGAFLLIEMAARTLCLVDVDAVSGPIVASSLQARVRAGCFNRFRTRAPLITDEPDCRFRRKSPPAGSSSQSRETDGLPAGGGPCSLLETCWSRSSQASKSRPRTGCSIPASLRLTKPRTLVVKASAAPLDITREPQYDRFAGGLRSWGAAKNALPTD